MELRPYWCINKSGGEWALSLVKSSVVPRNLHSCWRQPFLRNCVKICPPKGSHSTNSVSCSSSKRWNLQRVSVHLCPYFGTCIRKIRAWISHVDMRFIWVKGIVSMQPNLNCLVQKVCLPLTRNSKVICQSTQGKIQQEQGGAWKYLRNVITIHTGAPPRGTTLLSLSVIKRLWN